MRPMQELIKALCVRLYALLSPPTYWGELSVNEIMFQARLRFLFVVAWMNTIMVSLHLGMRVFVVKDTSAEAWGLGFVLLCFSFLTFYVHKTRNVRIGSILLHLFLLVLIPLRTYQNGGIYSVVLFFYMGQSIYAYVLNGRKAGHLMLAWSFISILFFALFGPTEPPAAIPLFYTALFKVFTLLIITVPIIFFIGEREKLAEILREYEKKQASYVIMRRLGHEIGNSLNIALGYLQISREENTSEALELVDASLEKVDEIVNVLREASNEIDLVDFLQTHEKVIHIMEKFSK